MFRWAYFIDERVLFFLRGESTIKKPNCNIYKGGVLPPCSELLGNRNPIIKDGKLIYKNENRLYYFIGTVPVTPRDGIPLTEVEESPLIYINIQISLPTYIIGLFINQIETKKNHYEKNCAIHADAAINDFIHKSLESNENFGFKFTPTLTLVYSNGEAILDPFIYTLHITPKNFLILLAINRLEGNPGLLFLNNSFATEDIINFSLAEIYVEYPFLKDLINH